MTTEYRFARPDDMLAIMRSQSLGFGASTAQAELEASVKTTSIKPAWRLCAFEEGEPVSQICIVPTTMYWHGKAIPASGVTDVFTHPGHRRRGHLRELMTRTYQRLRDEGRAVAILEASFAAIYQRFGWSVVYTSLMHDFDPRHLRFVDDVPVPGRVRVVMREQARAAIGSAYERFAAQRTLTLRRGDFEWARALRLNVTSAPPVLVAVYEEAGEALGYAIYRTEDRSDARPSDPGQRLIVLEWMWLTPSAHRGLIQFLASHDLVDSVRIGALPLDDPLWYHVQEPRALNTTAADGALARIVDVQEALSNRTYCATGRVLLGLEDRYAPWNSGVWELSVDGAATMKSIHEEPQIRLTPRVLAMLACGYQSASTLARAGLLHAADAAALSVAQALFRTERVPVCLDHWM